MNKLKNIIGVVFLLASAQFFGQDHPDREKIKSLKIAFITEKLDLNSKEAEKFWPLYNEYERKKHALRKKEKTEIQSKIRKSESLSSKEADNLLKQFLSLQEEEEELRQTFIREVAKVVSAKRTFLMLRAEKDFKRQLIRQYRHKKSGGKR